MLLFGYSVLRAVFVSFSWDESFSTMHFVLPGVLYPKEYDLMTANHHLLSVWGAWCSRGLFGHSELALRIPALLGHLAYLAAGGWIALRFGRGVLAVAVFLVLNAHPYVIDYFGLARGYGPALGLQLLSMAFLMEQVRRYRRAYVLLSMLLAALAAYANLMQVLFLAAMLLVQTMLHHPWKGEARMTLVLCWSLGALALMGLAPMVLGSLHGGSFYYGAEQFWQGTVAVLGQRMAYDRPVTTRPLIPVVVVIAWTGISLYTAWSADRNSGRAWRGRPALVLLFLFSLLLLIMAGQHVFLGTPWPRDRTSLFLLPPFLLLMVFTGLSTKSAWGRAGLYLLAIGLTLHLLANLNLTHTREWSASGEARKLFGMIEEDAQQLTPMGRVITVSSGQQCFGVSEYYRMRLGLEHLSFTERLPDQDFVPADYYLVESWGQELVDHANWELLHHSASTGTSLFRDRRSLQVRGVAVAHLDQGPEPFAGDAFHGMAQLTWVVPDPAPEPPVLVIGSGMVSQHDERNWITFVLRRRSNGTIVQERMIASKDQTRETGSPEPVSVVLRIDERLRPGDEVRFICLPYIRTPGVGLSSRTLTVLN